MFLPFPFPVAACPVGLPNASASACRRVNRHPPSPRRPRFTLRVTHHQVAAVSHDGYEHDLRTGHAGTDAVLDADARRRFLALALVQTVTVSLAVGDPACTVEPGWPPCVEAARQFL
jgi:hypothetical protein